MRQGGPSPVEEARVAGRGRGERPPLALSTVVVLSSVFGCAIKIWKCRNLDELVLWTGPENDLCWDAKESKMWLG